ncbi:MAG: helix-turn-helix domain-containing protein, partial [Mucilaginibacter sp.]
FSDNFYRAQYNFIPDPPPNVDENELLIAAIEYKVERAKATVLIIDNITCLRGGTENSAVALSLMKSLKALKTDHNLSILVLAHTPKRRNATQPISADDLHGSKLLINFADSAFAIGKSTADPDLCYVKQIKQRNTRQRYGPDNVCLCRIQKPGTFLHFQFEGYSAEYPHLLSRTATERRQLADKIAALAVKGFSQREISRRLGVSPATVNRLLRGCADVQMRECADEEGFAEDLFDPILSGGAPDCVVAGVCSPPCRTPADEVSTDDEGYAEMQLPEKTDNQTTCANLLPCATAKDKGGTRWEGYQEPGITYEERPDAEHTTAQVLQSPPMTNDHQVKFNPGCDRSTSAIDKLLTPQLLEQILQTMARKNSIREEESDNFNGPNTSVNTGPDVDGP